MSSSRRIGLNCGLAPPPTTTTCHTPNTPEILNTIVNISFPQPGQPPSYPPSTLSYPPQIRPHPAPLPSPCYSDCSTASSSPLASPSGPNSSVQTIHSQFIKEGLKMKVRQKLKSEPEDCGVLSPGLDIKTEPEVTLSLVHSCS